MIMIYRTKNLLLCLNTLNLFTKKFLKYTAQTLVDEKWEILTEEERRFIEKFKKKKKSFSKKIERK